MSLPTNFYFGSELEAIYEAGGRADDFSNDVRKLQRYLVYLNYYLFLLLNSILRYLCFFFYLKGILECHYDHLPRRSIEFQTLQRRRSIAPSVGGFDEPRQQRPDSLAESTIEALKCEAKLDVIDNTTSEPLYAEIPCWRPPSEHAVEIVNLNGEAVTEL